MIVDLTPLPNSWSIEKIQDERHVAHGEIGPTLMVSLVYDEEPFWSSCKKPTKDGYWQTWKRMSVYRFRDLRAAVKPQRAYAG